MAYAFNSIQSLLDQEKDGQGSIFGGGEQAPDAGQMQTGGSGAGGGVIGSSAGGNSPAPMAKAAPVSNTVAAFSAQAGKNQTTGGEQAKYLAPATDKIKQGVDAAQNEANAFAGSFNSKASDVSQDEIGKALKSGDTSRIQGFLAPKLSNNEFGASEEAKGKLSAAQNEIGALSTSAGLGEKILGTAGGGEFNRRIAKGVASNVLGGDAYKAALADAKKKAEAGVGQIGTIETGAKAGGAANLSSSLATQKRVTEDALNQYKRGLESGAQGRSSAALTNIGGSGYDTWNKAQQDSAFNEFLQGLSPEDAALAEKLGGSQFGSVNKPMNLSWQQFVSPEDFNQMGQIDTLLNRQPTSDYSPQYGGEEQFYNFDKGGYQGALQEAVNKKKVMPVSQVSPMKKAMGSGSIAGFENDDNEGIIINNPKKIPAQISGAGDRGVLPGGVDLSAFFDEPTPAAVAPAPVVAPTPIKKRVSQFKQIQEALKKGRNYKPQGAN